MNKKKRKKSELISQSALINSVEIKIDYRSHADITRESNTENTLLIHTLAHISTWIVESGARLLRLRRCDSHHVFIFQFCLDSQPKGKERVRRNEREKVKSKGILI